MQSKATYLNYHTLIAALSLADLALGLAFTSSSVGASTFLDNGLHFLASNWSILFFDWVMMELR